MSASLSLSHFSVSVCFCPWLLTTRRLSASVLVSVSLSLFSVFLFLSVSDTATDTALCPSFCIFYIITDFVKVTSAKNRETTSTREHSLKT